MKKVIKTAMFAVTVIAAGFGAVKAYDAYTVKDNYLMVANIEALSLCHNEYILIYSAHPVESSIGCDLYVNGVLVHGWEAECIKDDRQQYCYKRACMTSYNH